MSRKVSIEKIGNTTVVKTWNKDDQSDIKTFNFNKPTDCHEENGTIVIQSANYPTIIFKPEQYQNESFTTCEQFLTYAAENFFFCESIDSSGSGLPQNLMDILENGDRDVKYVTLADGENYSIEPEEDRKLLLAITFNGDNANATVTAPFQVDILNPEYKILVYERPALGATEATGINGKIDYIAEVINVPAFSGKTSHYSKDNSIAVLKLIDPELISVTYQSYVPIPQSQIPYKPISFLVPAGQTSFPVPANTWVQFVQLGETTIKVPFIQDKIGDDVLIETAVEGDRLQFVGYTVVTEIPLIGELVYKALISQRNVTQNTGELIIGNKYKFLTVEIGDNFFNVGGGGSPTVNDTFTATDTTPLVWINGSVLLDFSESAPTAIELINTIGPVTFTYEDAGRYKINRNGAFPTEKTFVHINPSTDNANGGYIKTALNDYIDFGDADGDFGFFKSSMLITVKQ